MFKKIQLLTLSTAILLSQLDLGFNEPQAFECKDEIVQIPTKVISSNATGDIPADTSSTPKDTPVKKKTPESFDGTIRTLANVVSKNQKVQILLKKEMTPSIYSSIFDIFPTYSDSEKSGVTILVQHVTKNNDTSFFNEEYIKKLKIEILRGGFDNFKASTQKYFKKTAQLPILSNSFYVFLKNRKNFKNNNNINLTPSQSSSVFRFSSEGLDYDNISFKTKYILGAGSSAPILLETSYGDNAFSKGLSSNGFYDPTQPNMNAAYKNLSVTGALQRYSKDMKTVGLQGDFDQLIFRPDENLSQLLTNNPKLFYDYILMTQEVNAVANNVGTGFIDPQRFITFCFLLHLLETHYGEDYKYSLSEAFFMYSQFFNSAIQNNSNNDIFFNILKKSFKRIGAEAGRTLQTCYCYFDYASNIDKKVPGGRSTIVFKYLALSIIIPQLEYQIKEFGKDKDTPNLKKLIDLPEGHILAMTTFLEYYLTHVKYSDEQITNS